MTFGKTLAASAVSAVLLALPAQAVPVLLGEFQRDYGSDAGRVNPGGNDELSPNFVRVSDGSSSRFFDTIDFSSITGIGTATIDRLEFTISASGVGPSLFPIEWWAARFQGSNPSAQTDDYFVTLWDSQMPQSIILSAATDTGSIDAFQNSVTNQALTFWFSEFTVGRDQFDLTSANLKVFGTLAPIPLPAAGWLMLAGLGGLGVAARRRKRAQTQA